MIWCLCLQNFETHEKLVFRTKEEFLTWRKANPDIILIGQNFLSFDGPVLNRLWDAKIDLEESVIDTLVLSYLYDPALNDGHSLDAWGRRLSFPKGDFSDWSCYSPGMEEYCHNDVELTRRVYLALTKRMRTLGFSEMSCWIEHQIRIVIDEQQSNGFYFHKVQAETFRQHLRDRQKEIEESIHKLFPPKKVLIAEKREKYNQDGNLRKLYLTDIDRYIVVDDIDTYDCYTLEAFNLGSPKQRVERLLELGWKPDKFTKKGFPQVDEDALVRLSQALSEGIQKEAVDHLAEWLVLQGRASMLDTWINNLGSDSRIHGRVITCGATTRRCTHNSPNTANIPSGAKAKYGKECRSFWGVEPDKGLVEVGVDASGLENVGLLHYLNNPKATEVLNKKKPDDIHSSNSRKLTELLGYEVDREWGAKTSWYACVPLDSRILTRCGWKYYNEIEIGEEVLGYNEITKLKEWTILRDVVLKEDEVFEVSNLHRSFRATKDHRWFIRQRGTSKRPLKEHYLSDQVRTTEELTCESNIIMNAPFNLNQDKISNVKGIDKKWKIDWVQKVLNMSHAERTQFLQGFLLADGFTEKQNFHWSWSQNKNEIAEGLLVASYLVHDGQLHVTERYDSGKPLWTVKFSAKSHITCQRITKKSIGIQPVWCPVTDLGSWVMRQGEDITITGNCLYGAYPAKLASIVKGSLKDGELVQEVLFNSVPGLKQLITSIKQEWKKSKGHLLCIDGGYVVCPSESATLNYKIQSLGSIVMKLAAILLRKKAREIGLWFNFLGNIHDEFQMETKKEDGDRLGKLAVWSIEEAARQLKFNLPLTGEYRIGMTWDDCH